MSQKSYILETASIVAEFNKYYYIEVPYGKDDYAIAIKALWSITCDNIEVLKTAIESDRNIYPVASCTRLILECLTDATFLSEHKDEARRYWRNQGKIQEDLSSREDKWEAFVEGSVNKYGQLSEKRTLDRIEKCLGREFLGDYNMFCFYSHPNIAALQWINAIGNTELSEHILLCLAQYLGSWFDILPNPTPDEINMKYVATKLMEAASNHLS